MKMNRGCMKNEKNIFFIIAIAFCIILSSTIQSNLTDIEDFALNIEQNSIQQQMKIESLEKQLKNAKISQEALENSVIEISAQADKLLSSLNKSERRCMNLKIALGVSISLSIITTGIMSLVLVNNYK